MCNRSSTLIVKLEKKTMKFFIRIKTILKHFHQNNFKITSKSSKQKTEPNNWFYSFMRSVKG